MLVTDSFNNFYNCLKKDHTLLIVNTDVDALTTCAILMYAFSSDDITYSVMPVDSWSGVSKAVEEHKDQACNVVFINCGGTRSLSDLNLPTEVSIFVLDSHRPVHLDNIYNNTNIRVLALASEIAEWSVPEASKIYDNGSDGEESEEDENEDIASAIERRTIKQQQKGNWKRNRASLLWTYYMNTWFSPSSAVFMLEIIHCLGKSNAEMMWCAAVGLSSQFTDQLISVENYTATCIDRMRPFIRKYAPRKNSEQISDDQLRVSFDKELTLPMYAHWSVYDSICNESLFICQSRLWSQKGEHSLKHILAKLGLTLTESKQNFCVMSNERRKEVFDIMEKHVDASFATFTAHFGYAVRYNSADFARMLSLQLECHFSPSGPLSEIRAGAIPALEISLERYKAVLKAITSLVFLSMNQGHIISTARYFIVNVQQSQSASYLRSRHCLYLYAHLLLRAFASAKNTRRASKPLIVAVPTDESGQWYLVAGIMPLSEILADTQRKSVIGRAFEHIAEEANIDIRRDYFESNIIQIRTGDRAAFFNFLETRLEMA
uniref:Cell division control protein 45 n=1 Tax=Ditylenchus dipsaci TaxID=166011 RepID=A0A915DAB1_9BILA